jgi:hypothetical protein
MKLKDLPVALGAGSNANLGFELARAQHFTEVGPA